MSHGNIDFAGPGALNFFAAGYRYNPPPGVDLDDDATLKHSNTGVILVAALDRARRGDRRALPALLRCIHDQNPIISAESFSLLGFAGSPTLLLQLLDTEYRRMFEPTLDWWSGLYVCDALLSSGLGWVVPPVVHIYMRMAAHGGIRKELGNIPASLGDMLSAPDAPRVLMAAHERGDVAALGRDALAAWREVVAVHGLHQPLRHGQPFDLRTVVDPLRALASDPQQSMSVTLRVIYEAFTGIDCSNWYDSERRPQRLQIAAEAERFAKQELDRYRVGHRYFAGHLLDDPPDPRAEQWSSWALTQCEAAIASMLPPPEPEDDDEEDGPGPDDYLYEGLFDAPADHGGDAYSRVAAVAQDAYLGEFDKLTPRLAEALELLADDHRFEYVCARLIGDAAPLAQLEALVEARRVQLFEQPDPRWQELVIMALAGAGTLRTLRLAADIIPHFDASKARYGRPWLHMQRALPKIDMSVMRAWLAADGESIRAWFEAKLAGVDDTQVLWRGEPLALPKLVDELAAMLLDDAPDLNRAWALRHVLQTMTNVDLAPLWTEDATLDVSAGVLLVKQLRSDPVVVEHVPGTRVAFGHVISASAAPSG